jgi:hypothetical protein
MSTPDFHLVGHGKYWAMMVLAAAFVEVGDDGVAIGLRRMLCARSAAGVQLI